MPISPLQKFRFTYSKENLRIMNKALYIVAGIFFGLVAFVLFTGLYLQYPVLAINSPVPFWANFVGFVVTTVITVWCFISAKRS